MLQPQVHKITYVVPATRVLMWVVLSGNSLAKPKSPIFGVKFLSRRILLALMSLCTICGSSSSWRNARPLAVPIQIEDLMPQFRLPISTSGATRWKTLTCQYVDQVPHLPRSILRICYYYLVMHDQDYCSPHIHRSIFDYFLEYSSQLAQQGLDAWHLLKFWSRSETHEPLALILQREPLQQQELHS